MKLFEKSFKNRFKKDNRGMSFVELICAVAVLSLATTAIGGAMVVSAENYQRNATEFDVQQEAQVTTNLIGNLVVDAVEASWDVGAQTLTIVGDGTMYKITVSGDKLEYSETIKNAAGVDVTTNGVLAENVKTFKVDDSLFDTSKNIKIELGIEKGGKVYNAVYNTTARNGEVASIIGAEAYAEIKIEEVVVLEPGQTYDFPISVEGMTVEQVGGFNWDFSGNSDQLASYSSSDTGATITLADTANGVFQFTVKTVNMKADAPTEPLALKTVTVLVRRVNDLQLNKNVNNVALDLKAGAVYRIDGNVIGTNLDYDYGERYDEADANVAYKYKNPKYVDFAISMTGQQGGNPDSYYYTVTKHYEDIEAPYVEIKLNNDLPDGACITITGTAKHPDGMWEGVACNKSSVQTSSDNHYYATAPVTDTVTIDKIANGPWPNTSGLKRGDFQYWVNCETSIKTEAEATGGNQYRKYIRIWESSGSGYSNDAEGWILIDTTGTLDIQIQKYWSSMFEPDKEYKVELMLNVEDSAGNLTWPTSTTPRNRYITQFVMEKSDVRFKCEELDGTTYDDYRSHIGTQLSPVDMKVATSYTIDAKATRLNMKNLKDDMKYTVEINDGTGWQEEDFNTIFGVNTGATEEENTISVYAQPTLVGKQCRVYVSIDFPLYSHNGTEWVGPTTTARNLFDVSGNGMFYINFVSNE